jgi:hypothetical protein
LVWPAQATHDASAQHAATRAQHFCSPQVVQVFCIEKVHVDEGWQTASAQSKALLGELHAPYCVPQTVTVLHAVPADQHVLCVWPGAGAHSTGYFGSVHRLLPPDELEELDDDPAPALPVLDEAPAPPSLLGVPDDVLLLAEAPAPDDVLDELVVVPLLHESEQTPLQ